MSLNVYLIKNWQDKIISENLISFLKSGKSFLDKNEFEGVLNSLYYYGISYGIKNCILKTKIC